MSLEHLSEELFREHLNSKFQTEVGGQRLELELVEVRGDKSGLPKLAGVERFSIYLVGPGPLPQSIYPLEHEQLGRLEIFIVPIAQEGGRFRYEAVFSRVTE
jgi:hypothetical protein